MCKKLIQHLALVLPLFIFAACPARGADSGAAAFTILYTSDTHGHVVSDEHTIGLDRIAGVKKALEPCLLVDSGDFLAGSPITVLDKGESIVRLMKKTGYVAAAVGNHEFSYGRKALDARIAQAQAEPDRMALISANIVQSDESLLVPASARTTIAGVHLCMFGLTTQRTKTQATPSAVADLDFLDPVATSRNMTQELRASGCDIIVALAHVGNAEHVALTSQAIAEATPGLDILIDGHAHKEFATQIPSGALVVSPGALGKKLGRLDVRYDRAQGKIVAIDNTLLTPQDVAPFPPDATLAAELAELVSKTERELATPVGETLYDLEGSRSAIRTGETNLGNLAADCLRAAHGADFALINGGSIRDSVKQGTVTGKDILAVFPFTSNVVSFQITGAELLAMLEHGLGALPVEDGRFPQVSGMIVHIKADASPNHRVQKLLLANGNPVDMHKVYTIAVNSFLAEGGDGYATLAGKTRYKEFTSPQEALQNYLRLVGTKEYAPGPAKRLIFHP